jgi:hypothetical protein
MTAHVATAGCWAGTFSTSTEYTFLAAGDDHVLGPVGEVDVVVVHVAGAAGVHPAAPQRLGGLLWAVPVAEHHVAAADDDCADLAARRLDVVRTDDAHLGVWECPAGGAAVDRVLVDGREVAGGAGGELGHAVAPGEARVGQGLERVDEEPLGYGARTVEDPLEAAQVELVGARVVDEQLDHGRHREDVGARFSCTAAIRATGSNIGPMKCVPP